MARNKTIVVYLMVVATILFLSCTNRQANAPVGDIFDESNFPAAEKLIWEAVHAYDFDRVVTLADSLAQTGDISSVTADYIEPNAPIGLWPELKYVGESIESFKNKVLLLYTDGLNEAEDLELPLQDTRPPFL